MTPSKTKALILKSVGNAAIETVPMPKLRDDYILVKTAAVAINPADYKSVDDGFSGGQEAVGTVLGCDYAGVVEEVGSKVTKNFKKGDRVAGPVHGSNRFRKEEGAFAEYLVARGDLAIKIPDNVSNEEAATLGIGITTVGQGLYQELKLATPDSPLTTPQTILIYGASTATGILGLQFAVLSGYRVITTSSPHNFDYLKSLGASETFDYHSPTCAEDIKAATGGELKLAWDCIASKLSAELCARAMSEGGGDYGSLLFLDDGVVEAVNPRIKTHSSLYYSVFGLEFQMAAPFYDKIVPVPPTPARPENFEYGKMFWELSRSLLESGQLKAARPAVNRGGSGLEGVLNGLQEMRDGNVSGTKLVYTI